MKKCRESNIELLRIICTLAIISSHFIGIGHVTQVNPPIYHFIYLMLCNLSRVSCSVFIIICAWFSVEKKFDISKIFHVWLVTVMFMVPLVWYGQQFSLFAQDLDSLVGAFMPVTHGYGASWFTSVYIVLIFISPILNYAIQNISRNTIKILLVCYLCVLAFFSTIFHENGKYGIELVAFIYLYLQTGYIKKYINFDGKDLEKKKLIIPFLLIWTFTALTMTIGSEIGKESLIGGEMYYYGEYSYAAFQAIPNILCAFCMFFLFLNIKIKKSRMINFLASNTFGIIIFHNVPEWNSYFYSDILKSNFHANQLKGFNRILYAVIAILVIFLAGFVFEMLRKIISGVLIENRIWYKTICYKINRYFNGEEKIDNKMIFYLFMPVVLYICSLRVIYLMIVYNNYVNIVYISIICMICLITSIAILYKKIRMSSLDGQYY